MTPELFKLMADAQQAHWWFRGRRAVLKQLIENAGIAPQPEILELGCGTGSNLPMLSAYGRVTAVELDDFAREYARATTGIDVHPGALPEPLPAFSQPFDLIGMFDVLEHIEAHGPALERVRDLLAPNGRLLVTVPAYQWLYGAHDRLHHHHRRYTAQSLRTLAEGAGLKVLRVGYFNTLLFPLAVLVRLASAIAPGDSAPGVRTPPAVINRLLFSTFALEAKVVGRALFPFGTSVAALLTPA